VEKNRKIWIFGMFLEFFFLVQFWCSIFVMRFLQISHTQHSSKGEQLKDMILIRFIVVVFFWVFLYVSGSKWTDFLYLHYTHMSINFKVKLILVSVAGNTYCIFSFPCLVQTGSDPNVRLSIEGAVIIWVWLGRHKTTHVKPYISIMLQYQHGHWPSPQAQDTVNKKKSIQSNVRR
jgi:hypothetical protein